MFKLIEDPTISEELINRTKSVVPVTSMIESNIRYSISGEEITVYNTLTKQLFSFGFEDLKTLYKSIDIFVMTEDSYSEKDGLEELNKDAIELLFKHGVSQQDVRDNGSLKGAEKEFKSHSILCDGDVRVMSSYNTSFVLLSETSYVGIPHSDITSLLITLMATEELPKELGLISLRIRHSFRPDRALDEWDLELIDFGNVIVMSSLFDIHVARKDFVLESKNFKNLKKAGSAGALISNKATTTYLDGLYAANVEGEKTDEYVYHPPCIFGYREDLGVRVYFPKELQTVYHSRDAGFIRFYLNGEEVKDYYTPIGKVPFRVIDDFCPYIFNVLNKEPIPIENNISVDPLI